MAQVLCKAGVRWTISCVLLPIVRNNITAIYSDRFFQASMFTLLVKMLTPQIIRLRFFLPPCKNSSTVQCLSFRWTRPDVLQPASCRKFFLCLNIYRTPTTTYPPPLPLLESQQQETSKPYKPYFGLVSPGQVDLLRNSKGPCRVFGSPIISVYSYIHTDIMMDAFCKSFSRMMKSYMYSLDFSKKVNMISNMNLKAAEKGWQWDVSGYKWSSRAGGSAGTNKDIVRHASCMFSMNTF